MSRTGVDSTRCAYDSSVAEAAIAIVSPRTVSAWATYAVNAGRPPHESANNDEVWNRPPNHSRLYATTTNAPNATSGASHGVHATQPYTPMAAPAAIDTPASVHRTPSGMRVCNGRPLNSSSACAPMPIASANAASVSATRDHANCDDSPAPAATYERCHNVYGGCRSVT